MLPFNVGFKAGFIPENAKVLLPFPVDYLMLGGDVRYAVLKGKGLLPALSVGAGYTYLRGGVTMPEAIAGGETVDLEPVFNDGGTHR